MPAQSRLSHFRPRECVDRMPFDAVPPTAFQFQQSRVGRKRRREHVTQTFAGESVPARKYKPRFADSIVYIFIILPAFPTIQRMQVFSFRNKTFIAEVNKLFRIEASLPSFYRRGEKMCEKTRQLQSRKNRNVRKSSNLKPDRTRA